MALNGCISPCYLTDFPTQTLPTGSKIKTYGGGEMHPVPVRNVERTECTCVRRHYNQCAEIRKRRTYEVYGVRSAPTSVRLCTF